MGDDGDGPFVIERDDWEWMGSTVFFPASFLFELFKLDVVGFFFLVLDLSCESIFYCLNVSWCTFLFCFIEFFCLEFDWIFFTGSCVKAYLCSPLTLLLVSL